MWFPGLGLAATLVEPAAAQVVVASSGDVYATIGEALDHAVVGDTLTLDPGTYTEHVDVTFDVSIVGAADGVVISHEGAADAVVEMDPGASLTLRALTIASGTTRGVELEGDGVLTIDDVTFLGTTSTGNGGAISAPFGGTLDLVDVTFDGTSADDNGGAVFLSDATFTCTRCAFLGTSAGGLGGAIYDQLSTITITDSLFLATSAGFAGGAVGLETTTSFTAVRTTFCATAASLAGSGIYGSTDVGVLTNDVFADPADENGVLETTGGVWTLTNNHLIGTEARVNADGDGTVVTLRNNLFVSTGTQDIHGHASATFDWNVFDGVADLDGAVLGANDVEHVDPLLTAYVPDGDCTNDVWWPSRDSPLLDAGDPALSDPDGSRSDVGAFGGAAADPALHADTDADGAPFLRDCDDADATAFPGADEICDGADDDCDGTLDEEPIDEGWWCDADGDGQGPDDVLGVNTCDPPPAADCDGAWLALSLFRAQVSQDCDDENPEVFYGAVETCAFGDHNCDGDDDLGAVDATLWFTDADHDTFGAEPGTLRCTAPADPSLFGGDCDDTTSAIHPDTPDDCDGIDQNCDGADGDSATRPVWFADADGDGFGSSSAPPLSTCADPGPGYALVGTDCDDTDPAVHPGAAELCNLADDDCNAAVDDLGTPVTWFPDEDGDGFGDLRFPVDDDCAPSTTSVAAGGDCDDTDPEVHPGAVEVCNGADDDCDGATDATDADATGLVDVWPDWDGDGFGACPDETCAGTPACPTDTGGATNADDCADGDPAVHPGASEIAGNDVDEDCDGSLASPPGTTALDSPGSGCACTTTSSPPGALALVLLLFVTVARANGAPTVPAKAVLPATEDTTVEEPPPGLLALATDEDGDVLTAVLDDAPDHGTLALHADGSYVFVPEADYADLVTFTWHVDDGTLVSPKGTVQFDVAPINDAPVAVADGPFVTVEDEPLILDPALLLANDVDVDDPPDALSAVVDPATRSAHGTFVYAGDALLYTPDADYAGPDVLTYWVSDALIAESAPGSVDVDVVPVDDVPLAATDVLGELVPEVPAIGNVLTNDVDPEGEPLTAELVVPALGALVTLDADGAYVVEPRPGFVGSDGFTYVARDSSLGTSTPTRASWFVLPGPDPGPDDTGTPPPCATTAWFLDADGDGFGSDASAVETCEAPAGHVAIGGDCDDTVATVFPGATETVADGVDQDCDGADNSLQPVGACSTGPPVSFAPLLLLFLALSARAAPTCAEDTPAEVDGALVAVWDAYARLDEPGFDRAGKALALAVACLDRAPAPVQIARLHQGMALVSFVSGQTRAARKSLAAARLLDPGWKLPLQPFAEGHPYRELWEAATDPGPTSLIGRAPNTAWVVDGVERDDAPTQRAFLLQVAEDGVIVWSGYLWSFDEIPDRGQAAARDALETPHAWWLSARVEGRFLTSHQASDQAAVWGDTTASSAGVGAGLVARWTPVTLVGAEVAASVTGPADPVSGGDVEPAGHAVVLLGGGGWSGVVQPHGAVRVGGAVGRTRAWVGEAQEAWVWTVPSLDLGLEAGLRAERWRVGLTGDGLLAGATTFTEVRLGADGGLTLGEGPVAFEAGLLWRTVTVPYEDADGSPLGTRTDRDLRLGAGIGFWL